MSNLNHGSSQTSLPKIIIFNLKYIMSINVQSDHREGYEARLEVSPIGTVLTLAWGCSLVGTVLIPSIDWLRTVPIRSDTMFTFLNFL